MSGNAGIGSSNRSSREFTCYRLSGIPLLYTDIRWLSSIYLKLYIDQLEISVLNNCYILSQSEILRRHSGQISSRLFGCRRGRWQDRPSASSLRV